MNMKEAFRFQNKLKTILEEAKFILGQDRNVTKTENTYPQSADQGYAK